MENETIDTKIRNGLMDIKYHLCKLPIKSDAVMKEYVFPRISIKYIRTTPDNTQVADIEVEIAKEEAKHNRIDKGGKSLGFAKYDSFDHYSDDGVEWQLLGDSLSLGDKALLLTQLQENILRNFMAVDPMTARTAALAVLDFRDKILQAKEDKKEQSRYQVRLDTIKEIDHSIAEANEIKIIDFLEGIFFDPKNYAKLQQHEREGNFDAGIPCKIKTMRQIEYE